MVWCFRWVASVSGLCGVSFGLFVGFVFGWDLVVCELQVWGFAGLGAWM